MAGLLDPQQAASRQGGNCPQPGSGPGRLGRGHALRARNKPRQCSSVTAYVTLAMNAPMQVSISISLIDRLVMTSSLGRFLTACGMASKYAPRCKFEVA